ncbi:ribosomal protein L18 [Capnocytophaga sp. oral taxon 863 str. F0517]|uniref:50S ribosomal protein L18 n=1 Tax=Capnocytophaga sp. oral taxon 863 TaxID=1227265 RepID=UPI0003976117|nr:50S ribosomal protein L18 [Capnocytophaga sp. oral taxon 863]ERI63906.1 ribosomal protein L18 [Capnocytophaga sp. oral taxon 863 str. F0517]
MALSKIERRQRIKYRIRKTVSGTPEKPRLVVFRSNSEIYAQIVDDTKGVTLVAASSRDKDLKATGTKTEKAKQVGEAIAKKALAAGIETISFDRGGYLYHGRVKSLAEGAREGGLKF